MGLIDQINQELKIAMKSGKTDKVAVLRLLNSGLKNEQIKLGHDLSQAEALKVIQREAKQRKDSIEAYQKGDRQDLADAEAAELAIIQGFLPAQMTQGELSQIIKGVLAENPGASAAQTGIIIGQVMQRANGRVDGAMVSQLVRQKLSS